MSNECCQNEPSGECCKNESTKECCKGGAAEGCCKSSCLDNLGYIYGAGLLRIWLGVRALQTGIEKYTGIVGSERRILIDGKPSTYGLEKTDLQKVYDLKQYHGIPESMVEPFSKEPLMPGFMLPIYDKVLGPALLILGLTVLLGIAPRTSLFFLGLLYISLTWGLILLAQDAGIAWLAIHMILIVMALSMSKHNRLCLLKKW
jgi:thiosulfate dehydrogenase [quinone] large subunit